MRYTLLFALWLLPAFAPAFAANSCGTAPLPTTPVGPRTVSTWQRSTTSPLFTVTSWRIPCSATDSMPVITFTPPATSGSSFVCESSLTLLQGGGLQTSNFYFRPDPPVISSFCGDILAPVTVAIVPNSGTPAAFDLDLGFSVDYAGFSQHFALAFLAYNPADYNLTPTPGPNSVNLFVQGKNILFRQCTVTTAQSGGGVQYIASCALEAPLKAGGFERYDY